MRLAKGDMSQKAFINADSYHWFALNAFYNSFCDKVFSSPLVTSEDFDSGWSETLSSPEYNASITDGVLAGV